MIAEIANQIRRLPMKSMLGVFLKNSMTCSWAGSDGDAGQTASTVQKVHQCPGARHRGEQGAEDAYEQGDGEPAHRAAAEAEQDDRRDQSGQVRVQDRGEGTLEPGVNGAVRRVAEPQLLAD